MRRAVLLVTLSLVLVSTAVGSAAAGEVPDRSNEAATAGTVRDWNGHAVAALTNPRATTPPTPGAIAGAGQAPSVAQLHLAMVQGAVYDAVNAIDGAHEPYLGGRSAVSPSASMEAAAVTAAYDVLVEVVVLGLPRPLQQPIFNWLDPLYTASLAAIDPGDAKDDGIAAGDAAARRMLAARANDGRFGPFLFTPGNESGRWRPTSGINDPFAWVVKVEPFLLERQSQFRTKGPKRLESAGYAKEYNEVKALGGNGTTTPSLRTPEQTALANFYTVNPVELFNRTFRVVAEDQGLTLVEEARLFAMLNMAGADSFISCWDDKAFRNFWRPITAIQLGDDDGNPKTVGDPNWMSLIAAPPYPEHPSGYNCVTGAFMHTAKVFFGKNKMAFSVERAAPGVPNVTRDYERFTDVVQDTIDARVYQGIHFRAADEQGAWIGRKVARWLDKHNYFQPVESEDDGEDQEEDDDD
jgi:hypothetical protein